MSLNTQNKRNTQNEAFRARIYGLVQGVGFRYSTQGFAQRRGVKGYVRNMSDGSVEVYAEGKKEIIEDFLAWLKKGPPGASVRQVDYHPVEYRGLYNRFSIEF
jgi:acylphosphatase